MTAAALLLALAAALLVPTSRRCVAGVPDPTVGADLTTGPGATVAAMPTLRGAVLAAAATTTALAVLFPPRVVVLAVMAALAGLGLAGIVHLRRSTARAAATAARVRETCDALADDLAAGASTERALVRAATDWSALDPVLAAHRLGLDLPDAWRALARRPGADGLRIVAAAWQVSGRTGQGLSSALRRVAADLRAADGTGRVVASELASARATGRLVAGLPAVAWLMGSGSGQHPVAWLLDGPAGWACLALGGALLLVGLGWIELLARSAAS